jgi:hypothetical protein
MADITTDDLRKMLIEILTPNNSGPQAPGAGKSGSTGGANSSIIDSLVKNAGELAGKFKDIVSAGLRLETAWNTAGERIGNEAAGAMATLRKYGGGPLAAMGDAAIKQSQQSMGNSNAGIGGGSFMEMTTGLRSAGLTLEDYKTALNSSKGALNSFAGNANSRAEQLNSTGSKLQDAAQSFGLTNQINKDELGKIMLISQMGRTKELASQESQDKAAGAAVRLADTINRASISSGKNRDVIEREMAERLSSAEVQAQLKNATDEQRQSIIASQAAIAGMGKGAGDAAQVIQAGGRLSQENQIQLMSMGPKAMGEFMKGNQLLANAKNEQERDAAQKLIDRSKVDTAEYQKTKGFQKLLQSAPDQLRGGLRTAYQENLEAGGINATQANRAPGQTPQQAEAERQAGVKNLAASKTESGAPNPQAAPQKAMTQLNDAAFNSAVSSLTLLNKEIVKLTNSKAGIDMWGKAIEGVYGKGGDVEKSMNVILNAGKQILGVTTNGGGTTGTGTTSTAPATSTTPLAPPKKDNKRAKGGPIAPDDVYVVGENGPELFKSKVAGDIVPTDKFQSMFGDIKTKISSIGGTPKTNAPSVNTTKMELPKLPVPKIEAPTPPKLSDEQLKTIAEGPGERNQGKGSPFYQEALKLQESIKAKASVPEVPKLDVAKTTIPKIETPRPEVPKFDTSAIPRAEQERAKLPTPEVPAVGASKTPEPPPKPADTTVGAGAGTVTMKDVNDSLIRLNTTMEKVLKATLEVSQHSEKTAKNSGKATGNRTHA